MGNSGAKKSAIKVIVNEAKAYEKKLNNRHFLVVYQEKQETKNVILGFREMNFLHLTGVKTNLSAQRFYRACLEGRLSEKDFSIDHEGKVQQKLKVLQYLSELLYHNCMLGYFIHSGIYIKADYFIGNTKAILSVGFRFGKSVDFPVTLYNENVKNIVKSVCKVLAIFSKNYNDEKFNQCTYLSKGDTTDNIDELRKVLLRNAQIL